MKEETCPDQAKTLKFDKVMRQAQEIVARLAGSEKNEALITLSASMCIIASGETLPKVILDNSSHWKNPHLIRRRRGGTSPIDMDQEVKEYILGIDRYLSLNAMHEEIVKKFGKKRAPSRSAIGRFLQRVNRENS